MATVTAKSRFFNNTIKTFSLDRRVENIIEGERRVQPEGNSPSKDDCINA